MSQNASRREALRARLDAWAEGAPLLDPTESAGQPPRALSSRQKEKLWQLSNKSTKVSLGLPILR
ncbi:hypothetical protein VRRI112168_00145 [Vreelandella rituensis]|uniref:Uncharacterized protein n=1 Tax=Vreelandella rituensis TaxID=2282306 RepID=A0A368UA76_9GAMM|nr:hypothetical protein [Halomonas rituensis]RCV93891.1 hypothetical protein DU506_01660 [Halomonas rituensis]